MAKNRMKNQVEAKKLKSCGLTVVKISVSSFSAKDEKNAHYKIGKHSK